MDSSTKKSVFLGVLGGAVPLYVQLKWLYSDHIFYKLWCPFFTCIFEHIQSQCKWTTTFCGDWSTFVRHILSFTVMLSHIVTLGNTMIHLIRDIRNRSLEVVTLKFFLISNLRCVLNVVCFLLGNFPVSEFYMPTFWNTLSVRSS